MALREMEHGFEPTLTYTSSELSSSDNDDPGKIRPNKDVSNASFYSYLIYSVQWDSLPSEEKNSFKCFLPFQRTGADEPAIDGYLESDRTYTSGGRSLSRSSVRSYL